MKPIIVYCVFLVFICSCYSKKVSSTDVSVDDYVHVYHCDSVEFQIRKTKSGTQFSKSIYYYKGQKIMYIKDKHKPLLSSNFIIYEKIKVYNETGKIIYKSIDKNDVLYREAVKSYKEQRGSGSN
jgi:hypothetical protein